MSDYNSALRKRASRAVDAALALIAVLIVVQIWLLMASVESWLAGHRDVALPAAIVSGVLFATSSGLLLLVRKTARTASST